MEKGSFKDFEFVKLKATYSIEIGDRKIEPGEVIAYFDKIQIAGLQEIVSRISANGGFNNAARVYWDNTREIDLAFSQGVFSKEQFALLANSKVFNRGENQAARITMREERESDENGNIVLKYTPVQNIFVYDKETGAKLEFQQDDDTLTIEDAYKEVIIDYEFFYTGSVKLVSIGRRLLTGFIELEGFTRIKDDITGEVITGLIRIPKLRLMSDISMRLGAQANPVVANFQAVGVPTGAKGNTYVAEFCYLGDDILSDF